jgi:hypothetical protein
VRGQQFWLSPDRAGILVTLWADTTVVHLFLGGRRLKSLASRLSVDDLRRLLADGRTPGRSTADPVVHQRQVRRP